MRYPSLEQAAREVAADEGRGRALGRDIGVYTVGEIVCRPTRAEAQEYFRYWTEEAADWGAVDYMLGLKGVRREADPDRYDRMRKALVHGQSGFPMIGSPDDVARGAGAHQRRGIRRHRLFVRQLSERAAVFRAGGAAAAAKARRARKPSLVRMKL